MPGNLEAHLDEFGLCECDRPSSVEKIQVEEEVFPGRYETREMPACGDCWGLL